MSADGMLAGLKEVDIIIHAASQTGLLSNEGYSDYENEADISRFPTRYNH